MTLIDNPLTWPAFPCLPVTRRGGDPLYNPPDLGLVGCRADLVVVPVVFLVNLADVGGRSLRELFDDETVRRESYHSHASEGWCGLTEGKIMFMLRDMKARVRRLEEFAREVAAEVELVKDAERSVLLPGERRAYLNAVMDTIAGAEAARVVMQKAVKRLERSELSEEANDDAA